MASRFGTEAAPSLSTLPALWDEPGTQSPKQAAVSPPNSKSLQTQVSSVEKFRVFLISKRTVQSVSWPRTKSKLPAFKEHGLCQLTVGLGFVCMVGITSVSKRPALGRMPDTSRSCLEEELP